MKISFIIFSIVFMIVMYIRIATQGVVDKEGKNNVVIEVSNWKKDNNSIIVEISGKSDKAINTIKFLKCELFSSEKKSLGYVKKSIKLPINHKVSKKNIIFHTTDSKDVSYIDCSIL